MIYDLAQGIPPLPYSYDVVVAGGGTVALLLASRLLKSGLRVLILESGGRGFEPEAQQLNEIVLSGRDHMGVANARARLLGGTSNLWGGQLTMFVPSDFQGRNDVSEPWPISYEDLLPHYDSVAQQLGLGPELDRSSAEASIVFPQGFPEFGDLELFYTRWLKEPNFARRFREELESADRLTVWLHAQVTHMEVADGFDAVTSFQVTRPDGTSVKVSGRQFVLANGTVEISRLLLATAKRAPSVPWADNSWVGAEFQDHLDLRAAKVIPLDKARFGRVFQNVVLNKHKYQPKLRLRPDAQGMGLSVACSFAFESSIAEHMQHLKVFLKSLLHGRMPRDVGGLFRHIRGVGIAWIPMISEYLKHHRIHSAADRGIWVTLHCEQAPTAASRIRLDATRSDRYGMPLADLDWHIDGEREINAVTRFIEALGRDFERSGIARLEIDHELSADMRKAMDKARDSYHQCGGARIGYNNQDGVVDQNLCVFGTSNLFVAGAAVFRTSSYANPTFTALALTARLAAHLSNANEAVRR